MADLCCGGWLHFYDGIALVAERPIVRTEASERDGLPIHTLHHPSRPAMEFSDGYGVWAWHGVRVPQWIIEKPETITPQGILAEGNAEIRRVMMERFGIERFVQESQATILDRCPQHQAELLTIDLPGDPDGKLTALKLVDFSPKPDDGDVAYKTYVVRVPPNFTRALDALAWSYDMTADEYVLAKQT